MADKEAKAVVRADNRRLRGDLDKSRRAFKRAFGKIGAGIKSALRGALSPIGIGAGAFGIAQLGKEFLSFEKTLVDLQVQAGLSGEQTDALRRTMLSLSDANAQSRNSLAQASLQLVNLQGAAGATPEKLRLLSEAALATSAPVEELAGLVFSLENAFDIKDPKQLREALDAIVTAGKRGAIPLGEMNLVVQQVGVTFAKFAEKSGDGAAQLAVSLQFLRQAFGSASEAGTGLEGLLATLQSREVELGRAGVKVKDAAGNFRPLFDILSDFQSTGLLRDAGKFNKAFGRRLEGRKALEQLLRMRDAVIEETAAVKNSDAIKTDAAQKRKSEAFKIEQSFNRAKEKAIELFTAERVEKFVKALDKMVDVLGFAVDNVENLVTAWAGFKVAGLALELGKMNSTMKQLEGASGAFAGNINSLGGFRGAAATGLAAASAFQIGWGIGRALDNAFGISDKIAGLAIDEKAQKSAEDTAFVRSLAQRAALPGRQGEMARQSLIKDLTRRGAIGPGGRINEDKLREIGGSIGQSRDTGQFGSDIFGVNVADAESAASAESFLKSVRKIVNDSPIIVQVSADGNLKATAQRANGARRSPQE